MYVCVGMPASGSHDRADVAPRFVRRYRFGVVFEDRLADRSIDIEVTPYQYVLHTARPPAEGLLLKASHACKKQAPT